MTFAYHNAQKASFGMGCFWEPEYFFSHLPGVVATRVGYSGGTKANPVYEHLGDHTETVEIEFDPSAVSYEELLKHFWSGHEPTVSESGRQYRSVIFYRDEKQRKLAEESKTAEQMKRSREIVTAVEPAGEFYPAEEYHQKYLEKLRGR